MLGALFWYPHLQKDTVELQKIQRRQQKLSEVWRDFAMGEGLNRLELASLEKKLLRGDKIKVYKTVNGGEKVNGIYYLPSLTVVALGNIQRAL